MAIVGAVLGHWLAYLLAIPDPHLRREILGRSGHGYWSLAVEAALLFGFAALGAVLLRTLRDRHGRVAETRPAALAVRLALVQVSAFVAMEVVERTVAGEALTQVLRHHLLLLGIAVQLAVACLGALVLMWFGRLAAKVGRLLAPAPFSPPRVRRTVRVLALARPPQVLRGGAGLRGPPLP
jgi:hypothetical protein